MDITKENFRANLANIFLLINRSKYTAIDLEMTGIQTKKWSQRKCTTYEEVYASARDAAETFHAVELGLTFICPVRGAQPDDDCEYRTFTVSIPISPMFATDPTSAKMAEVTNRQLSFSYASVLALDRNKFDLSATLGEGLPYLSRQELELIRKDMLEEKRYEYINPADVGDWAVTFYHGTRQKLRKWLEDWSTNPHRTKFHVFDPQGTGVLRKTTVRLVHQLVREEFPHCRCARDRTDLAMAIRVRDEGDENRKLMQDREIHERIQYQLGVASVVDTLFKQPSNLMDPDLGPPSRPDMEIMEALGIAHHPTFYELYESRSNPNFNTSIVIGHNILHDLCFLHAMFLGPLPETFNEFQNEVHKTMFAAVFDTKVMTALMTDEDAVDETLQELFILFNLQNYPRIRSMPGWGFSLFNRTIPPNLKAHEAGYDSYMTAEVFLKAAFRQLEIQAGTGGDVSPQNWLQDPARGDPSLFTVGKQRQKELPSTEGPFFSPVANVMRLGTVGCSAGCQPVSQ